MLNSQDLLVLRASLTFWFEEMGLYDGKAIADYANVNRSQLTIGESEVRDLEVRIRNSIVRYAIADIESQALIGSKLLLIPPTKVEQDLSIASVLIPKQSK